MHDNVAFADFGCGETGHFSTENHCHPVLLRVTHQLQCATASIENLVGKIAGTSSNRRGENGATQSLI
jgi:hypothetical protein